VNGIEHDGGVLLGAIALGRKTAVRTLLDAGSIVANIWAAAATGRIDLVRQWAQGASPSELEPNLIVACRFDQAAVASYLLDRGVRIDAVDGQGFTGLHWAGWEANLQVIDLLLGRGAPLEVRNVHGGTVLGTALFAARYAQPGEDHAAVVERLCAAGARLDAILQRWTGLPEIDAVLRRHGFAPPPE
jgi:hypothetical protein